MGTIKPSLQKFAIRFVKTHKNELLPQLTIGKSQSSALMTLELGTHASHLRPASSKGLLGT